MRTNQHFKNEFLMFLVKDNKFNFLTDCVGILYRVTISAVSKPLLKRYVEKIVKLRQMM